MPGKKVEKCKTCRYISRRITQEPCNSCNVGVKDEVLKKKLSNLYLPKARIPCDDCDVEEGIWEIHILEKYWGTFNEKCGLYCDECLVDAITGYHTGGGLTSDFIDKIVRKRTIV